MYNYVKHKRLIVTLSHSEQLWFTSLIQQNNDVYK